MAANELIPPKPSCTDCTEYYAVYDTRCSKCWGKRTHEIREYTIRDLSHPDIKDNKGFVVQEFIRIHLLNIYEQYRLEEKWIYRLVSTGRFRILKNLARGLGPLATSFLLCGGSGEFMPCALTAHQADELLEQSGVDNYRYAHAICPFVIDPWNFQTSDGVLLCYYRDFGNLLAPPLSLGQLKTSWKILSFIHPYLPKSFMVYDVSCDRSELETECCVCLEPLNNIRHSWRCPECLIFLHGTCMTAWITNHPTNYRCPHCNFVWNK